MKKLSALIVLFGLSSSASAQEKVSEAAMFEASLRQQWEGIDHEVQLRKIDKQALTIVDSWRSGSDAPGAKAGQDGRVIFPFGATVPRVFCTPMRFCDIELQDGEKPTTWPVIGDKEGWEVVPAKVGQTIHAVVKPKAAGLVTNLAIFTNRRIYHIELVSSATDHMPFVAFSYPEDRAAQWRELIEEHAQATGTDLPSPKKEPEDYKITVTPGALNFNYSVELEGRWRVRRRIDWKPKRVFDDGEKTIIEMPRSVLMRELPILLVRDGDGRHKIVNFRAKGKHFIVDRLFSSAALIKGVGRKQERVAIRREED